MKRYTLLMLLICVVAISSAQNKKELIFSAEFKKGSSDNVLLRVKNLSSKTYYYFISVQGITDTGYVAIASDIKSLGHKEVLALVPLKPKSVFVKSISKKYIIRQCYCSIIKKIRFHLFYFTEADVDSEREDIETSPL